MDDATVHPEILAGDPIAQRRVAKIRDQDELLEAAGGVLDWLEDRRRHMPSEMLDGRETRHRRALREAVRRVRSEG